jgi:hypothetical protein
MFPAHAKFYFLQLSASALSDANAAQRDKATYHADKKQTIVVGQEVLEVIT